MVKWVLASVLMTTALSSQGHARDAVRYLGAFGTVGSSISVTPMDETRLEFCWITTSQQSRCDTYVYTLSDGKALFSSFADGRFAFDLVTNVLVQERPDGVRKTADMTPVAR